MTAGISQVHDVVGHSTFDSDGKRSTSHRVVVSQLPASATASQILDAITTQDGIISILMTDTSGIPGAGAQCAFVQFVSPEDAHWFIINTARDPLTFVSSDQDENGVKTRHPAQTWRLPSSAWGVSPADARLLGEGYTRSLRIHDFPPSAVWFFISCLGGPRSITNIQHGRSSNTPTNSRGNLDADFVSVFECKRVMRMLENNRFPYWTRDICEDRTLRLMPDLTTEREDTILNDWPVIPYRPRYDLQKTFDLEPYNTDWPEVYLPIMQKQGLVARPRPQVTEETRFAALQQLVTLSRNHWSWEGKKPEEQDELLSGLLDSDDGWRAAWARWFREHRTESVNLQAYEAYGRLAAHRRQLTQEQGLTEVGVVPLCSHCHEHDCLPLHLQDVPLAVKNFWLDPEDRVD